VDLKRLVFAATGFSAFALSACSGPSSGPPPPFVSTPTPSATATGSVTPSPTPSGSSTPGGTPTPTPAPTGSPFITGSLSSIVVCAQAQMTCGVDLDPNATSGEGATVLVLGVRGTLSYTNTGGPTIGTVVAQVYATKANSTEYEVIYKAATASPATDSLTIADSGTHSSLTIPITIVSPGVDQGSSFFALFTSSGTVCPGQQVAFETRTQGNAAITLAASDPTLISIGQNGTGNFALDILKPGSGTVTATAGASTVVYPVDVPGAGFTTTC
jgi:hypothetical protein